MATTPAGAAGWGWFDDALARQMLREWLARRLLANKGGNGRRRAGGGLLGRKIVFGRGRFEALDVERHAEAVVPDDLQPVAARSAKHEQIAGVRIAAERPLHVQGQAVHALAHIGSPRRQPNLHMSGDRNRGLSSNGTETRIKLQQPRPARENQTQEQSNASVAPPARIFSRTIISVLPQLLHEMLGMLLMLLEELEAGFQ